jgi:CheY-like chemotaxis protein
MPSLDVTPAPGNKLKAILIVDDSEDDLFMLRRSFKQIAIGNPVRVVEDGRQALAYLSGEGPYADREEYPLPALVLIDLQLRGLSGFEVIQWIRSRPEFQQLALVAFSSSEFAGHVKRAYAERANSYLVKPIPMGELTDLVRSICRYWITMNKTAVDLPPNSEIIQAPT